jgi:hypothetical protein
LFLRHQFVIALRCVEQSKGLKPLSLFPSWQGCITNTSGYDFRKGQAHAGALERPFVNELPNLSVEFEFPWWLARGAAATTPSERPASKRALNGRPAGFCRPLR